MKSLSYVLLMLSIAIEEASTFRFPRCLYFNPNHDKKMSIDMSEEYFKGDNYAWISKEPMGQKDLSLVEIGKPIKDSDKYSLSMMFWPYETLVNLQLKLNQTTGPDYCRRKLGLSAVDDQSKIEHSFEVINSMTVFEKLWLDESSLYNTINDIEFHKIYFSSYSLDKTSKGNEIGRKFTGSFKVKNNNGMFCSNVVYITSEKAYIICWKLLTGKIDGNYTMQIQVQIWVTNVYQNYESTTVDIRMNETQFIHINELVANNTFKLKSALCKNAERNDEIDIYLHARFCSFFMIMTYQNDKFKSWKYPALYNRDQGAVFMNNLTFKDETIVLYQVDYVDNLRFILTQSSYFKQYDNSTYPSLFYFDAESSQPPSFLGKGMLVSFKKQIDESKESFVSEALLIISTSNISQSNNKSKSTLTIQRRKFYKGSFYGDQVFKLNIEGAPNYFKAIFTSDYIIYIDWSDKMNLEPCNNMPFYSGVLSIAMSDKPGILRTLMNFDKNISNPVVVGASSYNNFLYIRYPYKIEMFNIHESSIDLMQPMTKFNDINPFLINETNKEYLFRITTSPNNSKPSDSKPDPNENLKGMFAQISREPLDKVASSTPSLSKDLQSTNFTLPQQKYSQMYYYTAPLEDVNYGNYIAFQAQYSSSPSRGKADITSFSPIVLEVMQDSVERVIYGLFTFDYLDRMFILISYTGFGDNILYEVYTKEGVSWMIEKVSLYDKRPIEGIQKLSKSQILIHIEQLLYYLDLEYLTITPIFKSGDYCGDKYAMIDHIELGLLTICGGMDVISLFITDPLKKKVDLSVPIKNMKLDTTTYYALKSEGIYKVFSSSDYNNHFGILTKPKTTNSGTASMGMEIRLRFFEVSSSSMSVDVMSEFEFPIIFDHRIDDVSVVMTKGKLTVFAFTKGINNNITESIKIFGISKSFGLTHEKDVPIPEKFRANLDSIKPMATLLTTKKNIFLTETGPKIILIFSLFKERKDILTEFDFIDSQVLKANNRNKEVYNILAILDPKKPATDCIKFLELPDGYEIKKYGQYYMTRGVSAPFTAAAILGIKKDIVSGALKRKIFFLNDHSLSIDFYMFNSLDNYFISAKSKFKDFEFFIKNYDTLKVKKISLNFETVWDFTVNKLEVKKPIIDIDLVNSNGKAHLLEFVEKNKTTGRSSELVIGSPFEYSTYYDSKVEEVAGLVSLKLKFSIHDYPSRILNVMRDAVSYKMMYYSPDNTFRYPIIERIHPLELKDFKDFLFSSQRLVYPNVEVKSGSSSSVAIMVNPNLSGMRKCTRFYYMITPRDEPIEVVACMKLVIKDPNSDFSSIKIYIFHANQKDSISYSKDSPEDYLAYNYNSLVPSKVSFADINLMSTLNHVIVVYTNQKTMITYKYTVFRMSSWDNGRFKLTHIVEKDTWWISPCFVNNFFVSEAGGKPSERFCGISLNKLDEYVLNYFCITIDATEIVIDINPKSMQILSSMSVEEWNTIQPKILIYDKFFNPTITKELPIVTDPFMYMVLSCDTFLTIMARIHPSTDGPKQLTDGTARFCFLSNPFEGFKFDMEAHAITSRYYLKAFVKKNETYLAFYSLPFEYVENISDSDQFISQTKIQDKFLKYENFSSIEPKYMHHIKKRLKSVDTILLTVTKKVLEKNKLKEDSETIAIDTAHTLNGKSLEFLRDGMHSLLTYEDGSISYLEYHPRMELEVKAAFLLSKDIRLQIRGMYNTSSGIKFNLISGNFTQLAFILNYMLPLVVLIVLILFMNWFIGYLLSRANVDRNDLDSAEKIKIMQGLVKSVFRLEKKKTDDRLDSIDAGTAERNKYNSLNIRLVENEETEDLEEKRLLRKKKEIKGMRVLTEDGEGFEEAVQVEYLRNLFSDGVLKIKADEKVELEVNRVFIEEKKRSFFAIEADKEKNMNLTEVELQEYEEFEKYMKNRKRMNSLHDMGKLKQKPIEIENLRKRNNRGVDIKPMQKSSSSEFGSDEESIKDKDD